VYALLAVDPTGGLAVASVASVRGLLEELGAAVRRLAEVHDRPIIRDDGTVTTRPVPPLLRQLRDAVGNGSETHLRSGRRGAPMPISPSVHDTLTRIVHEVSDLHLQVLALAHTGTPAETRLRQIAQIATTWTDTEAIMWVLRAVTRWTAQITAELDPPRRLHLACTCPRCGTRMVRHHDPLTGESTLVPALSVDSTTGARCAHCSATWSAHPDQLTHLARVLHDQRPA
jgi:hypothetical protein